MVKTKKAYCRKPSNYRNRKAYENYKMAKKEVQKMVWEARFKVYENLYCKLETKDGEKDI